MIIAETFRNSQVAVFGLGRTGITSALSLQAGGAHVYAWDDNPDVRIAARKQGVNVKNLRELDWSTLDNLVLSPGVPDTLPAPHWSAELAHSADVPIICDIEIFAREVMARAEGNRPKIIAVTGTNGKSTTTALIGHILESCGRDTQIGGNIGRGVLDLERMHAGMHYVLELSSYQLERTYSLRANAAIFLNLSPDHLERHGDIENYEMAKRRIFNNQTKGDTIVIGVDDDSGRRVCSELVAANGRRIIPISGRKALGRGVSVIKGQLYDSLGPKVIHVVDLKKARALEGVHNGQNAAAAYAAVLSLGVDSEAIGQALLSFPGLAHRMENIGKIGPVRLINDSKATNADAARQALMAYDDIFWIAGGVPKAEGIEPLADTFSRVKKAYLIGEAAPRFHKTLAKADVPNKVSGTLEMAVLCAVRDALNSGIKNPIVLLSPACASFDQFANFEERGDAFRQQVYNIVSAYEAQKKRLAMRGDAA